MRLTADVDIVNRLLPTFNIKSKSKATRSQVSVGCKPSVIGQTKKTEVFLMICSKQDRNGSKYKIRDNIEQVFSKFMQEGKVTIRFNEPPNDVCLSKANPVELKSLMSVIRMAYQGKELDKRILSTLAPASAKQVERLRTKLTITSRKDYPLTTGFSQSLFQLKISECTLKRIDNRILKLNNLINLDLSQNNLQSLPEEWDGLTSLKELVITHNSISAFSKGFLNSHLKNNLALLDLSHNKLTHFHPDLCAFNVVTLKLDNNCISGIPRNIQQMHRLQFLSMCSNRLVKLPLEFCQLRLDKLDLFGNPFPARASDRVVNKLQMPHTLLEFSARAIKKLQISYTDEDLPVHLVRHLGAAKSCVCGSYCFDSVAHFSGMVELLGVSATVNSINQQGQTAIPTEGFLCSLECMERYEKKMRISQ